MVLNVDPVPSPNKWIEIYFSSQKIIKRFVTGKDYSSLHINDIETLWYLHKYLHCYCLLNAVCHHSLRICEVLCFTLNKRTIMTFQPSIKKYVENVRLCVKMHLSISLFTTVTYLKKRCYQAVMFSQYL